LVDGPSATGVYDLNNGVFHRVTMESGLFLRTLDGTVDFCDFHIEEQNFIKEIVGKHIVDYAATQKARAQTSLEEVVCVSQSLKFAWIELTSRCNQICLHCFVGDQLNQFSHVPKEQILEYVDTLIEHGVRKLVLSGGEPTIHPNFEEIVDYIGHSRVRVSVLSNASHPKVVRFADCFIRNDVKLEVPLLGWNGTHDQMTGIKGSFEKTKHAIEYFSECGVDLMLGMTVTSLNAQDITLVRAFADKLGLKLAIDAVYKVGWAEQNCKQLIKTGMQDILRLVKQANKKNYKPLKQRMHIQHRPEKYAHEPTDYETINLKGHLTEYRDCGQKIVAILSNGDVSPCILLRQPEHIIGSLKTHTLKQILNRQTLKSEAFDERIRLKNIPSCCVCEARFICKGSCMASAYALTGSIQQKNPLYDGCYYQMQA